MRSAEQAMRNAARDLLWLRQAYPEAFARVCRLLTDADVETLEELARFQPSQGGDDV